VISLLLGFLVAAGLIATCDGDVRLGLDDSGGGTFEFSFEDGFDGWRADSADFCDVNPVTGSCPPGGAFASTDVSLSRARASEGSQAVRLFAENFTDAVKLWIERPFEVDAGGTYRVEVSWDFGTSDAEIGAWTIIGALTPFEPTAAVTPADPAGQVGDFVTLGGTSAPGAAFSFLENEFSGEIAAGAGGEIWVGIGVWGTFEVTREYFVDSVSVRIERVD
jgi:hypothetical protein